jgi:hypothetical protein
MDFTTKTTPYTQAQNLSDAMKCAECDRPLLWQGAVCTHCYEQYAHQAAVEAGEKGQYTCPACAKFFDTPSTAPSLAKQVPWYQPCAPIGCPHCSALLEWKPAAPVKRLHVFLGHLPLAISYVFGWSARENMPSLFVEKWMGFTTIFVLLLIGLMNQWITKNNLWQPEIVGSWARKAPMNRAALRILLFAYLPLTAASIFLIVVAPFNFWGFIALLTLFLVSTVFNCIRWLRDRKR